MWRPFVAMLGCLIVGETALMAEPYIPAQDSTVLERLRLNAADPVARQTRALRKELAADPRDLTKAVQLAAIYLHLSRTDGDPRYLGHAQATLAPWWPEPLPPPPVLLLRATIRQRLHEFDQALTDLDRLIQRQPAHAQAWLTKATILQVQGRYGDARRSCQVLVRLAARHVALACAADLAGLTGQSQAARESLKRTLSRPGLPAAERVWLLTILAEMSERTGAAPEAERFFTEALRLAGKDHYVLGAYADFLLDHDRPREVLALLQNEVRADGLLLRLALAEHSLGLPAENDHRTMLAARFAAARERGGSLHLREEARFTLALLREPDRALALAQANWAIQREPWDARLLLASALASGKLREAAPVLDWLKRHHIEDQRLRLLAAKFPGWTS
ncbi:tetratricopeptide repeat protein [Nitrospira moscoviensis]|uniref:Uncharacterized protein n=1 Tax=Nitrospira moscoviensis TaxID=42253 RepID=A0A0K2G8S7_NITMO|nr:hypothetical protein [Nitrospira moscoviensis]ALA56997.1 conserved exported protein of unknown function [Nitrospira moscoviensis]